MLGRGVGEMLLGGTQPAELWDPGLRELAGSLDLVMCNLECCLSSRGTPTTLIPGKPFFFRGPPAAIASLQAIGVRVAGLANNHLLDFGVDAGRDTVALLRAHGIAAVGAGEDVAEARAPAIVDCAGRRVGVLALADHPDVYAAGPERFGTAYARLQDGAPAWLARAIEELRAHCELIVVFVHWGANMTSRPAAWQQRVAVSVCAAGADLVAGHSAHVFHGVGFEHGRPVLFDLGDALDDYRVDRLLRNDLGVLAIWTPGDPEAELELVGLALDYCHTRLASGAEADWIVERLARACGELGATVDRVDENRVRIQPA